MGENEPKTYFFLSGEGFVRLANIYKDTEGYTIFSLSSKILPVRGGINTDLKQGL